MFRFANPEYLYLLILVVVLAGLFVVANIGRRQRLEKFGNFDTLTKLMPSYSAGRPKLKFGLYLLSLIFLIVAMARPQYGSKLKEVNKKGVEIMIAVDVSNSMLAKDFEPTRLERTKFAINRLLNGLDQDQVGLIVFAGDAYVQLPITGDYVAARNFADQISTDMVSKQGTALGSAIDLARSSFSSNSEGSRVIIIITDGENHEDDAVSAAKAAAEDGIKIYTIGIGTPTGAPIEIDGEFIKDDKGEMVVTKLNEEMLEEIALLTEGAYIRSTNKSTGLQEIISKINDVEKGEFKTMVFESYDERYQYFIAVAMILLLVNISVIDRRNKILSRFNIFRKKE